MLLSNDSALKRLNSPDNLLVRLKALSNKKADLSLFLSSQKASPGEEPEEKPKPTIDKLIDNAEAQIKLAEAHDKGIKLLNTAIDHLASKLDDVKAEKLPAVISSVSKVVSDIRRERNEANKDTGDRVVHHHFYLPEQKKIEDYEVIDVTPSGEI